MKNYDVILVGTGQATGTILPELLRQGKSIAVVESSRVGGTCLNWGCTPTKTLVASARVAQVVRTAAHFGVDVGDFRVNFAQAMKRVDELRTKSSMRMETWLTGATDLYKGLGSFASPNEISIGDSTISGKQILLHVGTRPQIPEIPGLSSVAYLDNKGLLELREAPRHLAIIGGSYIALEFAQIFRRLGCAVTVIQRSPRILTREDADISDAAAAFLTKEGVEIITGARMEKVEPRDEGIAVHFAVLQERKEILVSHLALATGRIPNSDTLNLGAAGVITSEAGYIVTDERLRTNVEHIYALGDVNGRGAHTHTSVHDGQVFLNQLQGGKLLATDRTFIHSVFIDPPLARVGITEAEARILGRPVLMATRPMSQISRAKEKSETDGLVKIIVDQETGRILGATILGVGGDEIINMLAVWITTGLPYTELMRTVLVHPTVAELIPWIMQDLKPLV